MRAAWLLGFIPLAVAPFACTSAFTTAPGDGGGGSLGASATGNGGFGATTTDTTSVGGGFDHPCAGLDDCDPAPVCRTVACTNNRCVYGFVLPNTRVFPQVANDCAIELCDGGGGVMKDTMSVDAIDDHPAGTTCLTYSCDDGTLSEDHAAALVPCSDGGGKVCDGVGNCVECTSMGGCTDGSCVDNRCVADACTIPTTCYTLPGCTPCATGAKCDAPTDCVSGVCTTGECAAPMCPDTVKNGLETGVDCGGPGCPPCDDDQGCQLDRDCASLHCAGGICIAPTCSDSIKNESESDVDCGGSCGGCEDGRTCNSADDCADQGCNADGICDHCVNDKFDPGLEGGIDCGKGCSEKCRNNTPCTEDGDCVSNHCCATGPTPAGGSTGPKTCHAALCQ